jgi:hypothetical protein
MVIHFVQGRKVRSFANRHKGEYRNLCTGQWENREVIGTNENGGPIYGTDYSTSTRQVTCPKCLNILIPRHEIMIRDMRQRRDAAIASVSTVPWQTNTEGSLPNDVLCIAPVGSTED